MDMMLPEIDFEKYLDENEDAAQKVVKPTEFFDQAYERIIGSNNMTGDKFIWSVTHDKFAFVPKQVSIWAGMNASGKSGLMGFCAMHFDTPTLICSFEMPPETTLARMIRQGTAMQNPSREYAKAVTDHLEGKIWIYNHVGQVKEKPLYGAIKYAARELGVKHIMIDSMVKVGLVEDYSGQAKFVDRLTVLAKDEDIHIHLVVHMRKQNNEKEVADRMSIKGAGEITDLADNVFIISRKTIDFDPESKEPSCFVRIAKNRHGEWEGTWGFKFDDASQQWVTCSNPRPTQLLDNWSRP